MDIKTRFLVLSDTHAEDWVPTIASPTPIDVVIHCGDLTEESKIGEYQAALNLLKSIDAPLKLVIAGNHDFTLDDPSFMKIAESSADVEPELLEREFGRIGDARKLFDDAKQDGIVFLDEGIHRFALSNGAKVTVYASPYTPSLGEWGFQYKPKDGHNFEIEKGVDIVITHGPPKGVLDRTDSKQRGGSEQLFAAVAKSQPQLHCFGHIHEGWGAHLVAWRDSENPSYFSSIDNEQSTLIERLSSLRPGGFDTSELAAYKEQKLRRYTSSGYCEASLVQGPYGPLRKGKETLFVNAAIQGLEENTMQLPWIVDIGLARQR